MMARLCCVALLGAALLRSSEAFMPGCPSVIQPKARTVLCLRRGRTLLHNKALSPLRMAAEGEGLSDSDLAGLLKRVAQAKDNVSEIPIVILDAILPRQRLGFATADPVFRKLIDDAKARADGEGLGCFGMLGVDVQKQSMLRCGTEVEITKLNVSDKIVQIEVVGTKRFWLVGEPWSETEESYYLARVEYVSGEDSGQENPESDDQTRATAQALQAAVSDADAAENVETARALERLVLTWRRLVVDGGRERQPNQIETVLEDLGPMPPAEEPRNRALWVAALINPLPALGVSLEIRPAVLSATTTAAALEAVLHGIKTSIAHLDGSQPMW